MQTVILAGGKGSRLGPYTTILPKPLLPVGEYPILEVIIRQLRDYGIKDLVLATGYLAQLIEAYFGNGKKLGVSIRYIKEKKPLGTAGVLSIIDDLEENFIVMNGDILTTLNYKRLFDLHLRKNGIATIGVTKRLVKDEYGIIKMDKGLELKDYIEKPTHAYSISIGVNVLNIRCKDYIDQEETIGMPDLLLRMKKNKEKVYCYESKDFWLDLGRAEDFRKAQDEFASNSRIFVK